MASNLGPGLRYNAVTGELAVRISSDAGNAARFGSDLGLYVPGPDTDPDPTTGRRSVAGLPSRAFGAMQGGAGSMAPFGAPYAVEYGVANRMDIIGLHTFALADQVGLLRWAGPTAALDTFTDNPSSVEIQYISSLQLPFLNVDAGTRVNPTGRNSQAPTSLLSPDGGWFGFYARQYAPITLAEALRNLGARAVAYMAQYSNFDPDFLDRGVAASIRAVAQAQAASWSILGASPYVDTSGQVVPRSDYASVIDSITGAGMTPCCDLFDEDDADVQIPVADIVAAGASWVRIQSPRQPDSGTSQARLEQLVAAGLQVIAQSTSRHTDVAALYASGVRAVTGDSPVYARGARGEAGDLDYRKTTVIPGLLTRTTMEGALTHETETGLNARFDAGWTRQSAPGRYFSARFGWQGGIGLRLNSQLLGEICPHRTPPRWRIQVRFRVDPSQDAVPNGIAPKLGLFTCAPTDRDISTFDDGTPPELNPWVNGYWCFVRVGTTDHGQVVLGKVTDGDYTVLDDSQSFPSIAIGDWIYMAFTATPTVINLAVGHDSLADDIIYNLPDTTHRGPYAFYTWEDTFLLPADNQGFAHGYAPYPQYATGQPMWEELT